MSLGEVSIPLCETIGNSAFEGSGLTEISLGDISFIGEYAFVDCINLKSISVDAELYYSIDGVLFQDDTLLCYPAGKNDSTYAIPNGIHSIVSRGFEECAAYKIILPEGFESIGDRAFVASSIKTMDLPSSVSIIGSRVFYDCYELDWVHFLGDVPTYSLESFSGTREDFVIYYDAEHSEGWPSQISKRTVAVWSDNNDANTINTPIIVGSVGFVVLIIGIAMFLNRK